MNSISEPKAKCKTIIGNNDMSIEFKSNEESNGYVVKYKDIEVPNVGKLTIFIDYLNRYSRI